MPDYKKSYQLFQSDGDRKQVKWLFGWINCIIWLDDLSILQISIVEFERKYHLNIREIEQLNEELIGVRNENRLMRKEMDAMKIDADGKQVRELIWLVDLSILQIAIAELQAQTQQHTREMNDCNDKWRVANEKEVKIQFVK